MPTIPLTANWMQGLGLAKVSLATFALLVTVSPLFGQHYSLTPIEHNQTDLAARLDAQLAELQAQRERIAALEHQLANEAPMKPVYGGSPDLAFLTPLTKGDCGDITFKPGIRIQSRYVYDDLNDNNDFFIRRFRLKASGDAFGVARYGTELKTDSTGRFGSDPTPVVENAWLDFTVLPEDLFIRVGLYDIPFSRNALTSDSKLLLMDRTEIKNALTTVGFADNTIGILAHGRPMGGRFEYAFGIFDNVAFENSGPTDTTESDKLMPTGRVAINLLDPAPPGGYADYRESYVGNGERLAIGANAGYLSDAMDGLTVYDLYAYGFDVFFNRGGFVFQAEYDWFDRDMSGGAVDVMTEGWYAQAGYLVNCFVELAARYEEVDFNDSLVNDRIRWTSIGMNLYSREHNLKIQTDYKFKNEQGTDIDNDRFQMQLQLDY